MRYEVKFTARFKKDYKLVQKRGLPVENLLAAINLLAEGAELPPSYHDHALSGNFAGVRECHIAPDWLLMYKKHDNVLVLELIRTGTHGDLFG